ncbi:hypothetical protein [Paenibacillus polymyxa]|uniref:hypothetical protein n=1 Tax=Paenibacillus polymyxa TaxID=1406 RepID=UPI001C9DE4A5|nr:hypothetical protein [Paenibacillus polymyxa]MBY7736300.1 hypothetical protein [Paenibacillus polymyxa]
MIDMLDMTNEHLNIQLAKIMGNVKMDVAAVFYGHVPQYCTNPFASLEVQARAIELDAEGYVLNLSNQVAESLLRKTTSPYYGTLVSRMLNVSPRERAEAAYMTLSSKDLHPLREDINGD